MFSGLHLPTLINDAQAGVNISKPIRNFRSESLIALAPQKIWFDIYIKKEYRAGHTQMNRSWTCRSDDYDSGVILILF